MSNSYEYKLYFYDVWEPEVVTKYEDIADINKAIKERYIADGELIYLKTIYEEYLGCPYYKGDPLLCYYKGKFGRREAIYELVDYKFTELETD